jgi:hypothetical protein
MNTQFRKDFLPERCAIHSRNRFREIRVNQPNPPPGENFSTSGETQQTILGEADARSRHETGTKLTHNQIWSAA